MSTTPQKRALNRYRKRLGQRGMARFEVLGLDADRELIRSLAKRLAGDGPDSARIRDTVRLTISGAVDPWSTEASSSAMPNSRQSAAKSRRRRPI